MITFPNAKINLGLNIVEKRPDGYHNLETIFYPIHLEDALEVVPLKDSPQEYDLKTSGIPIKGDAEDNMAIKAYRLLKQDFALPPLHIYVYKHIPMEAGLGGGSSDAAFMIKLLNKKFSLGMDNVQMENYASRLGSDCAFFIQNRPVFATGIGNIMTPADLSLKGMYIVLVKPDISISTKKAYSKIIPQRPSQSLQELIKHPIEEWKNLIVNDFEKSVFVAHPGIAAIKDKLYGMGAVYASMSGSGSAVYGIFKESVPYVDGHFGECFCCIRELE